MTTDSVEPNSMHHEIPILFCWPKLESNQAGFLGVPDLDELIPSNDLRSRGIKSRVTGHARERESARRPRIAQRAQLDTATGNALPIA